MISGPQTGTSTQLAKSLVSASVVLLTFSLIACKLPVILLFFQ